MRDTKLAAVVGLRKIKGVVVSMVVFCVVVGTVEGAIVDGAGKQYTLPSFSKSYLLKKHN